MMLTIKNKKIKFLLSSIKNYNPNYNYKNH